MSTHESDKSLKEENDRLRSRVEELERMLAAGAPPRADGEAPRDDTPYKAIFEMIAVPVIIYDDDGWLVALNDVNCAIYGTTREQAIGSFNIVRDSHMLAKDHLDAFVRAREGEATVLPPIPFDIAPDPATGKPGRRLWTQATYFPVTTPSGARLVGTVGLDVTAQVHAEMKQRESAALLGSIIDNAPLLIYAVDTEGRHTLMNRHCQAFFGKGLDELLGKTAHDLLPKDVADACRAQDLDTMSARAPVTLEETATIAGVTHVFMTTKFALRDDEGKITGVCGISLDITERARAEEKNRRLQEAMLRAKEEMLRSISTPLLPIAEGVLVAPLVGEVTCERAEQLLQALLSGVASQKARLAILDITGVPEAGRDVTDALVRAAQSVRLLGAEIVLTGVRPSVAQSLVDISADLAGIVTRGTLERGVAYALAMHRAAPRPPRSTRAAVR